MIAPAHNSLFTSNIIFFHYFTGSLWMLAVIDIWAFFHEADADEVLVNSRKKTWLIFSWDQWYAMLTMGLIERFFAKNLPMRMKKNQLLLRNYCLIMCKVNP